MGETLSLEKKKNSLRQVDHKFNEARLGQQKETSFQKGREGEKR